MEPLLVWALAAFAFTVILLVAELFIPSGGILGTMAAVSAIAGVILLALVNTTWGLVGGLSLVVLAPITVGFVLRIWPHTPLGRRIIGIPTEQEVEQARADEEATRKRISTMVGRQGVALTDLRPVGIIEIDGTRTDALAETTYIKAGTRVRIVHAEATVLRVREV
jgi:membrane-bound ClpP family serine protease